MANLSAKQRKNMPKSQFAIPEDRAYPIPDKNHARLALAMVTKNGSPTEKKRVRSAVSNKFPSLRKRKMSPGARAKAGK